MMRDFILKEIRPGRFAKIKDGMVIGMAKSGEVIAYNWKRNLPEVEVGVLEVALALSAIMAVISAVDTPFFIKIPTSLAFILSLIGSYSLYTVYLMTRLPLCLTEYVNRFGELSARNFSKKIYLWVVIVWPTLSLIKALQSKDPRRGYALFAEFAYLMLYWGLLLAGILTTVYVIYSFW